MRVVPLEKLRNIGIIAHIDAGKTTVTERILYYTGLKHKIGEVHEGEATMDWMVQEKERGITITAASTTCFWSQTYKQSKEKEFQINIIDTPGHIDFTAEVERSLRVLDGAVVVFDGVAGVEPQSETVWRQADKYRVPRICFINKLDRLGADFDFALSTIWKKLTDKAIALQMPVGKESDFWAIIDLIQMKMFSFEGKYGEEIKVHEIPQDLLQEAQQKRQFLLEKIAENDEIFMEKFFSESFTEQDIREAIRRQTLNYNLVPVFLGSALKNKGIQLLLDGIVDYLPSPFDIGTIKGEHLKTKEKIEIKLNDEEPLTALVFKIMVDPYVGTLSYIRIYSGILKRGQTVLNVSKNEEIRIGRIVRMHANFKEEVEELHSGDIGAVVGLKNSSTGDTLSDPKFPILLEKIQFAEPVISMKIEPKTKADQEKLGLALNALVNEDPTFRVTHNQETMETIISGMGELHLEIKVDRLKREFGIDVNVGKPQVAYRETITKTAEAEGKYIRQSGGRGQYGHVWLRVEPLERGKHFEFVNAIKGGIIPDEFIPAIEKGVKEAMEKGVLAGFPISDIRVTVFDGSFHEVDSSDFAFRIAGAIALQEAVKKAGLVMLEPIMKIFIYTPDEYLGDVTGDFLSRRGKIENIETRESIKIIEGLVPLAEMFGYATRIRSITQGRGFYNMEFSHYDFVPQNIQNALIEERVLARK